MASKLLKRNIIFILILLAFLVLLLIILIRNSNAIKVETGFVKRGTITSFISAPGNVRPETEVQVSSDVSGRVVSLPVKEGQKVQKGQLLVQIDPSSYQAQVNQSRANLDQARASLNQSSAQWERTKELYKSKLISTQEMENSRAQYQLDLARTRQAKAALDEAIDQLNETTIKAPIDGTITRLDIELGEIVVTGTMNFAGTVLMIVADLSQMRIECDVDEADISSVHPGKKARITIDAFPDTVFDGTVTEVGNARSIQQDQTSSSQVPSGATSSAQNPAVSYTVKVDINKYKGHLKPDMTVNVDIITASKQNALIIPVQAIIPRPINDSNSTTGFSNSKRPSYDVYTIDKNKAGLQSVTTGIFGDDDVEIVKGLSEGQEIITGPFSTLRLLKDGIRIQKIKNTADPALKE